VIVATVPRRALRLPQQQQARDGAALRRADTQQHARIAAHSERLRQQVAQRARETLSSPFSVSQLRNTNAWRRRRQLRQPVDVQHAVGAPAAHAIEIRQRRTPATLPRFGHEIDRTCGGLAHAGARRLERRARRHGESSCATGAPSACLGSSTCGSPRSAT